MNNLLSFPNSENNKMPVTKLTTNDSLFFPAVIKRKVNMDKELNLKTAMEVCNDCLPD